MSVIAREWDVSNAASVAAVAWPIKQQRSNYHVGQLTHRND